jgi:hypothetical protein
MDNTVGCDSQHVLPKQILDFQMITSMLEALQDSSLDSEQSRGNPSLQELIRELDSDPRTEDRQMLDSFATLLAIDKEIVAVTTKAGTLFSSPTMEVMACSLVGHRSNSRSLAATVPSSLSEALEGKLPVIVVEIHADLSDPMTVDPESPQIIRPEQSAINPQNPIPFLRLLL